MTRKKIELHNITSLSRVRHLSRVRSAIMSLSCRERIANTHPVLISSPPAWISSLHDGWRRRKQNTNRKNVRDGPPSHASLCTVLLSCRSVHSLFTPLTLGPSIAGGMLRDARVAQRRRSFHSRPISQRKWSRGCSQGTRTGRRTSRREWPALRGRFPVSITRPLPPLIRRR